MTRKTKARLRLRRDGVVAFTSHALLSDADFLAAQMSSAPAKAKRSLKSETFTSHTFTSHAFTSHAFTSHAFTSHIFPEGVATSHSFALPASGKDACLVVERDKEGNWALRFEE